MTTYRERHLAGLYDADREISTTKAAEAKADKLGVDINTITGSGKDGKITVADVENAAPSE